MDIGDRVRQEVLSENLICHDLQLELDEVKEARLAILNNLKSQLLNDLVKGESLVLKLNQVSEYMVKSSITLDDMKMNLPKTRMTLGKKVADIVKTILNVLDVTWLIINEFKYTMEQEKNAKLDAYYTSTVNALLMIHLSVLIATYDDASFIQALESLHELLKARYMEAETNLNDINKQLKEYNDIGPEFETLKEAYKR
ncbi:hypothetical protein HPULCUR_009094 [Helicostylum pulchrum]|uniref:Uncharacterized protein n=1 Tax=Helicostylum pulchrum TaxID=562976 RepID=A0ABP9Y9G2_9FUNG